MSLYLGSEIFDIHRQPLQGEFSHLFVRQGRVASENMIHVLQRTAVSLCGESPSNQDSVAVVELE